MVLAGGNFTHTSPPYLCYLDASTPSNPYTAVNITPNPIAQNCVWSVSGGGKFRFNGVEYTNYAISLKDQGQQFIGDGAGNWRQIGYNPWGTYS